jgi:hypothetical protein
VRLSNDALKKGRWLTPPLFQIFAVSAFHFQYFLKAYQHLAPAGDFGIEGFPSIKLISANKQGKLISKEYKGERSAAAIVEWGLVEAKRVALERIGVKRGKSPTNRGATSQIRVLRAAPPPPHPPWGIVGMPGHLPSAPN